MKVKPNPDHPDCIERTLAHPTRFERVTFAFGEQLNRSGALGFSEPLRLKSPENKADQGEYDKAPTSPRSSQCSGIGVTAVTVL
jgi:hypothetical protein